MLLGIILILDALFFGMANVVIVCWPLLAIGNMIALQGYWSYHKEEKQRSD